MLDIYVNHFCNLVPGLCINENCPYRHVNVNKDASVCEGFLRGYCSDGDKVHFCARAVIKQ